MLVVDHGSPSVGLPVGFVYAKIDDIEVTFQAQIREIEARMAENDMVMRQFLPGAIATAEFASFQKSGQARIASVDAMTLDTSPVSSGDNIASLPRSALEVRLLDVPLLVATPDPFQCSEDYTTATPDPSWDTLLSWSIRLITSC